MTKLNSLQQKALCDLADPESQPNAHSFALYEPGQLLALAEYHGVSPTITRKLKAIIDDVPDQWQPILSELEGELRIATIVTLALEGEAEKIRGRFNDAGVPYKLVKGAAFAKDLYPSVSDRPFTDLDFVLPPDRLDNVADVMSALGYKRADETRAQREEIYREQKWILPGVKYVLVEVHTDLVHQPSLRRRITYGFEQLDAHSSGDDRTVEHLMTAVIHGSVGHKFHNLKLAVDVLQALRRISSDAVEQAAERAAELHITYELAASAKLIVAMFPNAAKENAIRQLSRVASTPIGLTRNTVTNAHLRDYWPSRLHRHVFRWSQIARRV